MRLVALAAAVIAVGCGSGANTPGPVPTVPPATSVSPSASSTPQPTASTPTPDGQALPDWLADGVVTRLPTNRRVVALTFDGGSGSQGAARIVATLLEQQVPATFFLTATFAQTNAALVVALARDGFLVGNHTVSHPHMNQLPVSQVETEVRRAADVITAITGKPTRPWFRFPFGECDAANLKAIHDLGYGAIGWTVDSRGWQGRTAGTATDVVQRVREALKPGAIVLMHLGANPDDGTTYDADALAGVITAIRAAGYGFVTLSDWNR